MWWRLPRPGFRRSVGWGEAREVQEGDRVGDSQSATSATMVAPAAACRRMSAQGFIVSLSKKRHSVKRGKDLTDRGLTHYPIVSPLAPIFRARLLLYVWY